MQLASSNSRLRAPRARTLAAFHAQPNEPERFVVLTDAEAARLRQIDRRIAAAARHADSAGWLGIAAAVIALALVARACWPQISALLAGGLS